MIIKLKELVMILDKTVQIASDSPVSTADYGLKRSKKKEISKIQLQLTGI